MTSAVSVKTAGPGPSRSKLRSFAVKCALLLFSSALTLALLEVTVRAWFPFFDPHANVRIRMTTNGVALGLPMTTMRMAQPRGDFDTLIHFNEDGFRDSKAL